MSHTVRNRFRLGLVLTWILTCFTASASPFLLLPQEKKKETKQTITTGPTDTKKEPVQADDNIPQEMNSATDPHNDNGITVGQPKQFDERTLALMLQSLEDKLIRSQFPDPSGLYSSTGRFAGATASTSSMALTLRGPGTPSVTTTTGSTTKDGST